MKVAKTEVGFTIVEMVVTLVIIGIFLTLFFQLFYSAESQRVTVVRRAAANDIAVTNLRKITARSAIPVTTSACDAITNGSGNPNNLQLYASAPGSIIASNVSGKTPTWATASITSESIVNTSLPSGTTQELRVTYPRGCSAALPANIISTVNFGSETVSRATYIN